MNLFYDTAYFYHEHSWGHPKKYKLRVAVASDEVKGATAEEFAKRDKALLVINGGFFTPEHRSIGLIVGDGKQLSPLHRTSWWSVFQIRGDKPTIVQPSNYRGRAGVGMALQCGPRLTIDGRIPKLKESVSKRSAEKPLSTSAALTGAGVAKITL